jgi:hypothetical protein
MTDSLRVTVTAPDTDTAEVVKEAFFKQLYDHGGNKVVFELPASGAADAEKISAFAREHGCETTTEEHTDELSDAAPVDFW